MKVFLLLFALLVATAVKAESPSQDETQEDDDVAEEFDNDHNDVPSDDESELDTADDLEALEEDFNAKDPIKPRTYYCGLCNACRFCRRSRRCSSSRLASVCNGCKYCSWSYYNRLLRRMRISFPRIRIPRIRVRRVRWGRRRRRWG